MAHSPNESEPLMGSQEVFEQMGKERLRQAVRVALIDIWEEEVTAFIGARSDERSKERRDQRNGHSLRDLETTVGLVADVPVPRTRGGHQTQVFERSHRRQEEWERAMGELFVKGVSAANVGEVIETLTGSQPSASTVSRVFPTWEAEEEHGKLRSLAERERSAFADGTSVTVIDNGEGCQMPILAVRGIAPTGQRAVLGFRVGDRETQHAWEDLLEDLKDRGVKDMDVWISDGGQAMLGAIGATFPSTRQQRAVMHQMEHVLSSVPAKPRDLVEPELHALFDQKGRAPADQAVAAFVEKYQRISPTAIECLQRDLDACLTFDAFPTEHGKTIRTNNVIERLFGEVKRRSHKMAAAFRNEGSCVLLFSAVIRRLTFNTLTMPSASPAQPASELLHTT
ncbi:MAG TPA: IS256 family transposase [Ktedonobacteraceae bacterium]|jgi:transposase-like protein